MATALSPRQAALLAGKTRFEGAPCGRCGGTTRNTRGGCVACNREASRRWEAGPKYNLFPGEREAMLAAQGGCCAICGSNHPGREGRTWCLDHSHLFAKNDRRGHRGLLCHDCNLILGKAHDNPEILLGAVAYLKAHEAKLAA